MGISSDIANKNILIVEDETTMRYIVKNLLHAKGFGNLIEASDGGKALNIMQQQKIDLVICDWKMPNMSGPELFIKLKQDENLKLIPFILLTCNDDRESVKQAIQAGIKNYFIKPVNPTKLLEKAVELLEQQNKDGGR